MQQDRAHQKSGGGNKVDPCTVVEKTAKNADIHVWALSDTPDYINTAFRRRPGHRLLREVTQAAEAALRAQAQHLEAAGHLGDDAVEYSERVYVQLERVIFKSNFQRTAS